ncbi:MAG: UpxY family transcription antiterminator [Bacteroidaceae bacterium]|nr:UpxY family transcription antiterminator [Bacteroidaceae bacterium]
MESNDLQPHTGIREVSKGEEKPKQMQWFVLRDLKRSNALLPAYKMLGELGFEVFTPLIHRILTRNGKRTARYVPFIPSLLFVHSTREDMNPVIDRTPTLQYRYVRGGSQYEPMVVPEKEMTRFVEAVQKAEHVTYFRPEDIPDSLTGKQVLIVGGTLNGYTGILISRRGSKNKTLQLEIPGVLCARIDVTGVEYIGIDSKSCPADSAACGA